MPESNSIDPTLPPLTVDSLAAGLSAAGVRPGMTLLAHTSLSRFGWIAGGAQALIESLLRVLGETGTLMMPAHTASNTEPSRWQNPPVPEDWWPIIRATMPAFDPARSPTRGMGVVAELFRTWPGVGRSDHPVMSFAAVGPDARRLLEDHALSPGFGERSPVGRLYELDGHVLLLGVGHGNNTSLHLAELRCDGPWKQTVREGCAAIVAGRRQWVEYDMQRLFDDDFNAIGEAYETSIGYAPAAIGKATVRLHRQRPLVDFALAWMTARRGATPPGTSPA